MLMVMPPVQVISDLEASRSRLDPAKIFCRSSASAVDEIRPFKHRDTFLD